MSFCNGWKLIHKFLGTVHKNVVEYEASVLPRENQIESLSAEFQQRKSSAETSKRSAFVLDWLSFVLVESAPLLHQESTCDRDL
jgi:hypothetical protein